MARQQQQRPCELPARSPFPGGAVCVGLPVGHGASIAAVSLGPGRVLGGEGAGKGVRRKGKGEEDLADG